MRQEGELALEIPATLLILMLGLAKERTFTGKRIQSERHINPRRDRCAPVSKKKIIQKRQREIRRKSELEGGITRVKIPPLWSSTKPVCTKKRMPKGGKRGESGEGESRQHEKRPRGKGGNGHGEELQKWPLGSKDCRTSTTCFYCCINWEGRSGAGR